jgi:hypothetical protein
VRLLRLAILLLAASAFAAACGVEFSSSPNEAQLFQSLHVTGSMRAGEPLTAVLTYHQAVPVEVNVQCEVRQGSRLVKAIGTQTVAASPGGSPKQTPVAGQASFGFTVDKAGAYKAECFTPADQDVYIIREFSIGPPAPATP